MYDMHNKNIIWHEQMKAGQGLYVNVDFSEYKLLVLSYATSESTLRTGQYRNIDEQANNQRTNYMYW